MTQINANVSGFDPAHHTDPRLFNDSPSVPEGVWTFDPGYARGHWLLPDRIPPNGWTLTWADQGLRVWLSLDEMHQPLPPGAYELALLKDDANQPMPDVLAYQPAGLPMIGLSGLDFVVNGARWALNGQDHFLALLDMLEGREPIVYPGGNCYRVFLTLASIPQQVGRQTLDPDRFPQFWDATQQLVTWAAAQGKYILWSMGDTATLGKDDPWCSRFVQQFGAVHASAPGLWGGRNEPWNGVNGDIYLPRPAVQMPCSPGSIQDASGSYGYDGPGMTQDFCAVHPRRDAAPEYKMLTHCNLSGPRRQYGKALVIDEGFKAGTVVIDGKQYNDPDLFRSQGKAYQAANGGIYHCFNAVYSQPLDGVEQACAAAFFA